ncbi:hypothetical protein ACF1GW_38790 [Streptomyces achromogenes]|uniref:hypothetical protein n=1 Tax=Streptomyces achromogenes TaxID=67255 RepID=UPI0036F9529F
MSTQNYLGEFAITVLAGITIELVKHQLDKRKGRNNHEPDHTDDNPTEQDE